MQDPPVTGMPTGAGVSVNVGRIVEVDSAVTVLVKVAVLRVVRSAAAVSKIWVVIAFVSNIVDADGGAGAKIS